MSTLQTRSCANCACFARMRKDGAIVDDGSPDLLDPDTQTVCRRNIPGARQVRIDVPELRDGQPVLDKIGRPLTRPTTIFQYGYQPIPPTAVCFDGWRAIGALPGEKVV